MSPAVTLAPMQPAHVADWARWRQEPNTLRYNPVGAITREALLHRIEGWDGRLVDQARREYRWVVLADGVSVGSIALLAPSWTNGYSELGVLISEKRQGQGIGTKAVALAVSQVFATSSLRRLQALVSVENQASQRLFDRLGFRREGMLRAHFLVEGRPTDEVVFGLLREEWVSPRRED